ncbi:MAG: hypothetical protein BGO01_16095 [Armatimonadetes bacterium 55-13]|nr:hypothetical protein [Armatimonadota bacterium]OJU65380.1 MAG: hypothetical protein BGO01_16095 [Armatimonadetes bacterium 55-13]
MKWLVLVVPSVVAVIAAQNQPQKPLPKYDSPMLYFEDHCQRCHGENGANYSPELGKGKDDAWLLQEITDMAEGPGQSPLEKDALLAQAAFHRSLIAKEPFLFITGYAKGVLSGETLPGAKVTAMVGKKTFPAKVKEKTWTVVLPATTAVRSISVQAKLNDKLTKLSLDKGWYSHSQTLSKK